MTQALVILGLVSLIFGGLVVLWAIRARKTRGLGSGKTLALDDLVLFSERLKIRWTAGPDRKTGRIFSSRKSGSRQPDGFITGTACRSSLIACSSKRNSASGLRMASSS